MLYINEKDNDIFSYVKKMGPPRKGNKPGDVVHQIFTNWMGVKFHSQGAIIHTYLPKYFSSDGEGLDSKS